MACKQTTSYENCTNTTKRMSTCKREARMKRQFNGSEYKVGGRQRGQTDIEHALTRDGERERE